MNIILLDDPVIREALLPLTFIRPVAEIRVGILTITDKWKKRLTGNYTYQTEPYLHKKYSQGDTSGSLVINGALCPDEKLITTIQSLQKGQTLTTPDGIMLAANSPSEKPQEVLYQEEITLIDQPWKIFKQNARQIRADFDLITKGRTSTAITDPHTVVYGKENLFIEAGVSIRAAIINAENGPVYLGKNTQVHEGAIINGAFALCEGSHINMGAKIKGDTTVGPYCKVGGEVSNSVIFGYSNKAHDGFLGNSVIGEWCNLGADTNTSNLKNNYTDVKIWDYATEGFKDTSETFCGLIMGDHTKCGINTMFNTGTVVGVGANIFGAGFPRNFIPSFSWGGAQGLTTFKLDKFDEVAQKVMARRQVVYDDTEKSILKHIFNHTQAL